jgi:DNA repair exonuclease SbcCD ATPase subunit
MQDKLSSVLREKERLTVERDSLREANEELKCLQLSGAGDQQVSTAPPPLTTGGPDSVPDGLVLSTTELRQRIVRLQHENNMLKLAQKHPENNADSLSVVQSLLDDANKQIDKMWKDNREANQRIIHLEAELREVKLFVLFFIIIIV